ncbi:MAG TPA: energy transducer TonB [Pyrinomonadaceae bacterium]|nr:energy transducer TonB [Pyrinomonadaceae bacterium]
MFSNLVESGSHTKDFKRKGSFFLGTLAFYGLLLVAAGVGSIYAYNVRLDNKEDLELVTLMRFPPAAPKTEPVRREQPRAATSSNPAKLMAHRPEVSIQTPYATKEVAKETTREVGARTPVMIDGTTSDPEFSGGPIRNGMPGGSNHTAGGGEGTGPVVPVENVTPPPTIAKATPAPQPTVEKVEKKATTIVSLGVINGKAISKPVPAYPSIGRAVNASGVVTVQILVDEEGRVVSAQATNGHPLLRATSVQAAYRARFTPTLLSNRPVKVSGFITYNFVLN